MSDDHSWYFYQLPVGIRWVRSSALHIVNDRAHRAYAFAYIEYIEYIARTRAHIFFAHSLHPLYCLLYSAFQEKK